MERCSDRGGRGERWGEGVSDFDSGETLFNLAGPPNVTTQYCVRKRGASACTVFPGIGM